MTPQNNNINKLISDVVDVFRKREKEFSVSEIDHEWLDCELRIKREAARKTLRRRIALWSGSVAAAISLLLLWRGIDQTFNHDIAPQDITAYALSSEVNIADGHIINIVPGCDTSVVAQNRASISCLANGTMTVNGKSIARGEGNATGNEFCQLVVPKGRRAEITFADGTHLWANSDSRVVYPQEFSDGRREIFISGEVYLDVAPDKKHPFVAKSRDFNVTVLGTSFNIKAYGNGTPAQVVLVSGKVELTNSGSGKVTMQPGELVDISGSTLGSPRQVDVTPYVSWKDNMLIYSNRSLADVFSRLNICYGREFVLSPDVENIKVTGKLYLKDNIEAVLHAIAFSAPVAYEEKGDTIYVNLTK